MILLAFSAVAFDENTPANKADAYSDTQASTTVSLRQ